MTELDLGSITEPTQAPERATTSGDEYCHIVMEDSDLAYCGYAPDGPTTCKPYNGEAICPSCGLATCPTCAVQSALNDRLEEM